MDSCTGMSQYLFTLIYNPVLCYWLCSSATGSSFKLAPMSLWGFCFSVFFILFWLHHVACGLLVAWPGSKPTPLALEAQSLSHWATREVPSCVPLRCLHPFVFLSTALLSDTSQYSRFSLCFPCPKGFPGDWDGSLPAMQETQVRSLSREEPLEKEMATHSSTLAWKFPWMKEHGRLQSMDCKESYTTEQLCFCFLYRYASATLAKTRQARNFPSASQMQTGTGKMDW